MPTEFAPVAHPQSACQLPVRSRLLAWPDAAVPCPHQPARRPSACTPRRARCACPSTPTRPGSLTQVRGNSKKCASLSGVLTVSSGCFRGSVGSTAALKQNTFHKGSGHTPCRVLCHACTSADTVCTVGGLLNQLNSGSAAAAQVGWRVVCARLIGS